MLTEQIAATMIVTDALDALGVPYAIGGSFASALHGVMRATMDADLVADLRLEHAAPLAQALGDVFYADVEMMRDVLSKLEWYRIGGKVSDRQWRDVLGVLKVQGERLDRGYMHRMAAELSVTDLLEQAFEEAR